MFYLFCGSIVFTLLIWLAIVIFMRRSRLIDDVPTSKTRGAFIGVVELKGRIRSPRPIISKITGTPCVYCTWKIQEQWRKWVTVSYYDTSSKSWKTKQRLKSGWRTLDANSEMTSFYLQDDEGKILVHPQNAQIEGKKVFEEKLSASNPRYHRFFYPEIRHTTHKRYFQEERLDVDEEIYLMGYSRLRKDIVELEIADHPEFQHYLISSFPEKQISKRERHSLYCLHFLLMVGVGLGTFSCCESTPSKLPWGWGLLIYLLLLSSVWAYTVQLSMIHLKNMVRQGLSNLDVQLKRRCDLIPQIVEIVQGYVGHEKHLLTILNQLRAERMEEVSPSTSAKPLLHPRAAQAAVFAEAYPELKSLDVLENLQKNLTDTEDRIALARSYYNNIATAFNTRLGQYPDGWLAKLIGLRPFALLDMVELSDESSQKKLP